MNKKIIATVLAGILCIVLIIFLGQLIIGAVTKKEQPNVPAVSTKPMTSVSSTASTDIEQAERETQKEIILSVEELIKAQGYLDAVKLIDESTIKDYDNKLANLKSEVIVKYEVSLKEQVALLVRAYDYQGAYEVLSEAITYTQDESIKKLYDMCDKYRTTKVFNGNVEHIFFHPLVAYPELAFDSDAQSKGFDNYFATVDEFKKVMVQAYERDFILIDPHLMYAEDESGKIIKRDLMIPVGKKPLILSTDDYNFLKYMRENGTVYGLALDENGKVVTFTDANGTRTYSDDNEIVPIIDKFVEEHPEFAYGGMKGAIGLNGYEGTLGYPTDEMDSPSYTENLKKAKAVADTMKANGWLFACHSYGHNHFEKKTLDYMKRDVDRWIKEVGAVVGPTDLYFYPYGEIIPQSDPKIRYMISKGYNFFFGVSQLYYLKYNSDNILQTRRNIDGISLRGKHLKEIFDTEAIIDSVRPK